MNSVSLRVTISTMKKSRCLRKIANYFTFLFTISIIVTTSFSCRQNYSGPIESISIGTTISEVNSLILVAQDQGYFTRNGINLTQSIYPSGLAAINAMLNAEIDMATGSEFAFAGEILSGENISTIGSISRSSIEYLVGRVDRGISKISELKGKTIGVPLGSRPEFALDRFLLFNGIDSSNLNLVNIPVSRSVDALVNGEVDAVASWQPYIDRIKEQMGDKVVVWDVQEDQARWIISHNLTTGKQTPNFVNYIYDNALRELKPDEVNIIR